MINLNDLQCDLVNRVLDDTNMSIPPFPSQDLAKLVLGYLAEEQLMTAYDEFLQASPYLDAFQNEYDRIFMTSLKSILAEYRAVKIYVETCKPNLLRKKIFQCTNLLDIVKLLVHYVDLNKIQSQEPFEKLGLEKHYGSANPSRTNTCETCVSLKLINCVCNSKLKTQPSNNQSTSVEDVHNSVETTPLADLPGNYVTSRKKQIKVLDKDSVLLSDGQSETETLSSNISMEENKSVQLRSDISAVSLNTTVKETELADSRKKLEEFDNVLKLVVDKNKTVTGSENVPNHRVSNASTFQDFASGVSGGEGQNPNVPDSSTSENLSIQAPLTKDYYKENVIGLQKRQLLLQVSHRNDNIEIQTCVDRDDIPKYPKLRVKPDDQQKVKILSDVKVTNKKKQAKNATSTPVTSTPLTSTPLMQMQTIVINGTQAYKHTPVVINQKYTKDEIMAMPTLIVVPASGPSKIPTSAHCQPIMTQNSNAAANATSTSRALCPLVIDVSPSPAVIKQSEVSSKLPDLNMPDPSEVGLVKTVDYTKNASAPKDNITFGASKTPHALPPVRKSSSTPRRTTHVRVLDFATPRRILHENINEQVTSQTSDTPVEIVLSSSPNVSFVDTTVTENTRVNSNTAVVYSNAVVQNSITCDTGTGSAKEITTSSNSNQSKKSNWDTELRALVANESSLDSMITKRKKSSKKKKTADKSDGKMEKKSSGKNIISPKIKKAPRKRRRVIVDDDDDPLPDAATEPDVPLKPTINIISGSDRVLADLQIVQENNKDDEIIQNKSNDKEEDCVETPEGDRLSLQNVIGARLNISDLLETPYKQALYDIQMGTPRFLHDLPGDPLSDIKITNIPTPRFLDTPKPVQATPSSWSSRPTDYSSGGSYYKPDDQDYMPVPDLRCIVSSSSKESVPESSDKSVAIIKDDERKSRPQRQCAKNVSYYRFATSTNKIKEVNDNIDAASTCSDSTGSTDYKNKEPAVISPRENSNTNKSGKKKRVSTKKIKSTAIKEKTKSFLKIKPRQTPTKITSNRNKKTIKSPNKYRRIRTTSKDKNVNSATPLVVAAPTKSRRKSSTPRKLDCTKSFNAENNQHTSPETIVNTKQNAACNVPHTQDSDADQISLRWSDDGLQEANTKELPNISSANECEDISKIKEYIQTTNSTHPSRNEGSLRADLIKRGFDVETAKIIERDLLDTPPQASDLVTNSSKPKTIEQVRTIPTKKDEPTVERAIETASSVSNDLQNDQDDTDEEVEVEFSVHECNEGSKNYFEVQHDYTKEMSQGSPLRLKDKFSMDICIDDGVTVRLRATPFRFPLDQDPIGVEEIDYSYNSKETEMAVSSIINMERLYTPLKESFKAQCFEIFDSTLTSIDTPLKANSPTTDCGMTETEIVLEEQQTEKDKGDPKKRKRSTGSDESNSDTKKTKYLLTSASIQNIDIESVLTKLHGP